MPTLPDAVIFDFDGVLVNSEALHHAAFRCVLRPLGLDMTWEEYNRDYLGFDDRGAIRARFAVAGRGVDEVALRTLVAEKGRAFERVTRELGAIPCPGAFELARALRGRVPLALCSGACRADIDFIFGRLGVEPGLFGDIVTADDVAASKPDPACYRLTLERLRARHPDRVLRAGRTWAIEDSPVGIAAAHGAGLKVLGLASTYPADLVRAADCVLPSLADLTPDRFAALTGGDCPGREGSGFEVQANGH